VKQIVRIPKTLKDVQYNFYVDKVKNKINETYFIKCNYTQYKNFRSKLDFGNSSAIVGMIIDYNGSIQDVLLIKSSGETKLDNFLTNLVVRTRYFDPFTKKYADAIYLEIEFDLKPRLLLSR